MVTVALTGLTLVAAVLGGYKRVEKIMTALLVVILVCFIVVAIKGLLDWQTWLALGSGLVPHIPANVPVVGTERSRDGFTQVMAIAGQALPPAVFLSYGYLAANAGYKGTADGDPPGVLEDGAEPRRDLGPLLRRRDRRRRNGTACRVHRQRSDATSA